MSECVIDVVLRSSTRASNARANARFDVSVVALAASRRRERRATAWTKQGYDIVFEKRDHFRERPRLLMRVRLSQHCWRHLARAPRDRRPALFKLKAKTLSYHQYTPLRVQCTRAAPPTRTRPPPLPLLKPPPPPRPRALPPRPRLDASINRRTAPSAAINRSLLGTPPSPTPLPPTPHPARPPAPPRPLPAPSLPAPRPLPRPAAPHPAARPRRSQSQSRHPALLRPSPSTRRVKLARAPAV